MPRELLEVEGVAAAVVVEMRRRGRRDGGAEELPGLVARERAELAADDGLARSARSSAVRRRCGICLGRAAKARSTRAVGGRCTSVASSSTEAGSAQCRSSSTSTSGRVAASSSRSSRTAR